MRVSASSATSPRSLNCGDEGYVSVRGLIIDVPDDQVDDARNAAGSCPERAITLLED
jgi:ferredoxin